MKKRIINFAILTLCLAMLLSLTALADDSENEGNPTADLPETTEESTQSNPAELFTAAPTPANQANYAHLITEEYIEIEFSEDVNVPDIVTTLTVNGQAMTTTYVSYYDCILTLKLAYPVETDATIKMHILPYDQNIDVTYEPFYVYSNVGTKSKIPVYGTADCGIDATYDMEYVVRYCAEGINKIAGRSDFLTLEASEQNMRIVVVAPGKVYTVPEYRHLYNSADADTRVTIGGTPELPIIVTTSADVMRREKPAGYDNDRFELIYEFAKLYWDLGVKGGWSRFVLGIYDDADTYNYPKHIQDAYNNALSKNLWPGTKMMTGVEEYFAYATMIWYEALPESTDGTWQYETFPVNTRAELIEYDTELYGPMVEIYGEFEFFSGYTNQNSSTVDSVLQSNFPWYKHTQRDNYDITGAAYAPLFVEEVNLISANQIELIFNREVKELDELRQNGEWQITWVDENGVTTTYTNNQITKQFYQWKTLTLQVRNAKWYNGYIGYDINGFTATDFAERGTANGGWIGDNYSVSPSALEKGQLVTLADNLGSLNGSLKVTLVSGADKVTDWAGNPLSASGTIEYNTSFKPYIGQVYRSAITGVYIYGDNPVQESSMKLAGDYIDMICANPTDNIGQKIADGMVANKAGAQIIAYGHHAYQQPGTRNTYGGSNHHYLYVEGFGGGICQTTEFNLLRDYTFTRYDNEFILGHEFAHSIENGLAPFAPDIQAEYRALYTKVVTETGKWPSSYAGSNRSEYFATTSNFWHGTMRESTDGSNNGTWTPVNSREELYRYDPDAYALMKKIYYTGELNLPGYEGVTVDGSGTTNDDIIKWGSTFSYALGDEYLWKSWSTPNQFDLDWGSDYDFIPYTSYPANKFNYNPFINFDNSKVVVTVLGDSAYYGQPVTADLSVVYDGITMVEGRDYTVTYANNNAVGTGTAVISLFATDAIDQTVTFNIVSAQPKIALSAPKYVYIDGDRFVDYTFTVAEIYRGSSVTLDLTVDKAMLDYVEVNVDHPDCAVYFAKYNETDGTIKLIAQMGGQGMTLTTIEEVSLVTVRFKLKDYVGEGDIGKILDGAIKSVDTWMFTEDNKTVKSTPVITRGSAETEISKTILKYDFNGNKEFDQGDIDMVIFNYFLITSADAEWEDASVCDVNDDGRIDVADLLLLYTLLFG